MTKRNALNGIMSTKHRLVSARTWKRLHWTMTVVWALLIIPTLTLWRDAVWWIAVMSLYANVAGHWSAAQASEADEHSPDKEEEGGGSRG